MSTRFEIFEVFENLWCVRYERENASAYIIKTSPGAVVVDAGPDPSARGMMMGLQRARVGLSSIRALVLTHWNVERAAGARRLKDRSGTKLVVGASCASHLTIEPDDVLNGGEHVEGGLEVLETEGDELRLLLTGNRALFATADTGSELNVGWILPPRGVPRRATPRSLRSPRSR